jgi:hypothetical protein
MQTNIELTLWQKKQITLLYYFSSIDYLRSLNDIVDTLMGHTDHALAEALRERRDDLLTDDRWGDRDTAGNWGNYGWPFLTDFKRSLLRDIAARSADIYSVSGANQFVRGTSELSLQWTTPSEEDRIEEAIKKISHHAMYMDETFRHESDEGRWDDYGLAVAWEEFGKDFARLPELKVRSHVEGVTGTVPPVSGVYVPQDDPHGTPQFAWCGGGGGELLECMTFNSTGLAALKRVGRQNLWFDNAKMYEFATLARHLGRFKRGMSIMDEVVPALASSSVADQAFKSRPCKWYFVELIPGRFEDYDDNATPTAEEERIRVFAGERCPKAGNYLTPAKDGSRRYGNRWSNRMR